MMLAGPCGTGKKMLVHAICTETGANMFDLTATNIAGKYPGKDGLKLMLHMIFKVSKYASLHKTSPIFSQHIWNEGGGGCWMT